MKLTRGLLAAVFGITAGCVALQEPDSSMPGDPDQPRAAKPAPVFIAKPAVDEPPPPPPAQPPPEPVPAVRTSEVETLIADFQRLRRMPAAELAREQETARQVFNQSRTDAARVRLAMAMAMPGGPAGEDVRALEMLDPLVKNPAAPLHGLAFMIATHIQDQRRIAGQLQAAQQNAHGLQQNNQALQQKLDALMSLERSLTERGETGAPRRR
jgi:hypothetical protein